MDAPGREAISEVFYGGEKRSKKKRSNPIFQGGALNFRSESGRIETEWRRIGYNFPQMEPLVTTGHVGPPTSRMGGLDDPDFIRMKTLVDWQFESRFFDEHSMQRDPCSVLANNRFASCLGKDCNGSITNISSEPQLCNLCHDLVSQFHQCTVCLQVQCCKCYSHIRVKNKIYSVFPSFPKSSVLTRDEAITALDNETERFKSSPQPLNDLRPFAPSHIGEMSCTFLQDTLQYAGSTTVFYLTHKADVKVWSLICDSGCCKLEAIGAEQRVHRQTKDQAIHLDVLHLFHFTALRTRFLGISGFADTVSRLYELNGGHNPGMDFMIADQFANCYYGAKCRELREKPLNRPCFTCPIRRAHGTWVNGCTEIAVDAKMDIKVARRLLRKRSSPAPNVSTSEAGEEIDCRQRSHLKRLFFPGRKQDDVGKARDWLFAISKSAFGSKLSKNESKALLNPDTSEAIISTHAVFESYRACIDIVRERYHTSAEGRMDDEMEIQLCRWFMAVTNTQCEVTQWLSLRDCEFIDHCLTLAASGSLSAHTISTAAENGVRRSLTKLVEVSLVPFSSDDDVLLTIDERVVSLLRESAEVARKENVAQARLADATKSFQVPEASDYSSGVCMFVSKRGGRMRPYPRFRNVGLGKGNDGTASCEKRGWTKAQHKRCQWGSDGNMTMLCVKSGVPIGTVFLDSPEGPSSATAAFYCYFPEITGADKEMRVVCDTPCKHATFAANRLGRFFHRWKFICDRFHLMPHKCKVCVLSNPINIKNDLTES